MSLLVGCGAYTDGYGPTGLYAREYQHCYYRGTFIGPCAAVLNPSESTAATIPADAFVNHFAHAIELGGNGPAPYVCPEANGCNGTLALQGKDVTLGVTRVLKNDAMLLTL